MSSGPRIPIMRPWLGQAEIDAAAEVLRSGWLTQGAQVAAFEKEFARFVGAPHACAVSSATTALHLALRAVGVGSGDEVVTVSHSFIATANCVRYCGAVPVFVDIAPGSFNLDVDAVEKAIGPRTRAILCVHQIGMPCDLAKLVEISRRRGIPLVEDAACAIGSEILFDGRWEKIGRPHGDIACFSFHPRKLLTTGDGGMLVTADPEKDGKFRLWRQHGMAVSDASRHQSATTIFEHYAELGFNYRMTDLQAAIGRKQLARLPELLERRARQVARYREQLSSVSGLGLPQQPAWAKTNWQSFCVLLPDGVDQRQVMDRLLSAGIQTRRAVMCSHREPAYRIEPWRAVGSLELSERAQDRGIMLPLYHDLSEAEQTEVSEALREAVTGAGARRAA